MKRISILGSTGSIGKQTLDVVREHKDKFEVIAISANSSVELLLEQIKEFKPKYVAVYNEESSEKLKTMIPSDINTKVLGGMEGLKTISSLPEIDVLLTAIVGMIGLVPTLEAIKHKKDIALANKETLVCAGKNEALKHPNWSMGKKISIDSSTLMNKGLEVIEAKWLFDVEVDQIDVVVHPQSIIHSMVQFNDSSVIAQLGCPDMRLPIQYALTYPERLENSFERLDLTKIATLTFEEPDLETFPCLQLAYETLKKGGTYSAVLNSANEVLVEAFLEDKIGFYDIPKYIKETLDAHESIENPTLEEILEVDRWTREYVKSLIK